MEENSSNLFGEEHISVPATTGQRFINHLIDIIIYYALLFVIGIFAGLMSPESFADESETGLGWYVIGIIIFLGYYTLSEGSSGKTIGKLITGTKVVSENGDSISYKDAFIRSLCRLVPLEPLSIFFSEGGMWHDKWSRTQVVKKKRHVNLSCGQISIFQRR